MPVRPSPGADPRDTARFARGCGDSCVRHQNRDDGAQPLDDPAGLVESPQMGVAGGENAICAWIVFLGREKELRHCLIEAPAEEMRSTDHSESRDDAKTQRVLDMLDRAIWLLGPHPEDTAVIPAACVARIERQCVAGPGRR
jgi:hypothetical protein